MECSGVARLSVHSWAHGWFGWRLRKLVSGMQQNRGSIGAETTFTANSMRYRLRTLLIGSILVVVWALTSAIAVALWGEEAWRWFTY